MTRLIRGISIALLCCGMFSRQALAAVALPTSAVEQWCDQVFGSAAREHRFAALVISVVQHGQVVFVKAYGFEDYNKGLIADGNTTRVAIGSVTKTFTGTAVLQLLEAGRIRSLDDPANRYLKRFQLPQAFGREITIRELMTHSAGLSYSIFGAASDRDLPQIESGAVLNGLIPPIISAPGTWHYYMNFATVVLAAMVEDLTAQSIGGYLAEHVFTPLRMANTDLTYDAAAERRAVAYAFPPDNPPRRIPTFSLRPAFAGIGAIHSTAADMARYMLAHLGEGETPILGQATLQQMHRLQGTNHPAVSGFGLNFFVERWNGERISFHEGYQVGFETHLTLLHDSDAGVFISVVGAPAGGSDGMSTSASSSGVGAPRAHSFMHAREARDRFLAQFLGPFQPERSASDGDVRPYTGRYWGLYRAADTLEVISEMDAPPMLTVRPSAHPGELTINGAGPFTQVSPGVFWAPSDLSAEAEGDVTSPRLFAFIRDAKGKVTHASRYYAMSVFERVGFLGDPQYAYRMLLILGAIVATGLAALLWRTAPRHPVARWLCVMASVLILIGIAAFELTYQDSEFMVDLYLGHPARFYVIACASNLLAVVVVALVVACIVAWRDAWWRSTRRARLARAHLTLVACAAALLLPVFSFFNLLGWHVPGH